MNCVKIKVEGFTSQVLKENFCKSKHNFLILAFKTLMYDYVSACTYIYCESNIKLKIFQFVKKIIFTALQKKITKKKNYLFFVTINFFFFFMLVLEFKKSQQLKIFKFLH